MSFITPIDQYDKKKARKRETRKAFTDPFAAHVVYIVGRRDQDGYKVGKTTNIKKRTQAYDSMMGPMMRVFAQVTVQGPIDATVLERDLITAFTAIAEAKQAQEWFRLPYETMVDVARKAIAGSAAVVTRIRGLHHDDLDVSPQSKEAASVHRQVFGHRSRSL